MFRLKITFFLVVVVECVGPGDLGHGVFALGVGVVVSRAQKLG